MMRLNFTLLLLTVCAALGVVTAQHRSTRLFQAIQQENMRAEQLEVEFNQLKADLYSLATHARVERIAREQLRMHSPLLAASAPAPSVGEGR